jgi:SMC interacting uncharacterized protein involved in chromosome segregation
MGDAGGAEGDKIFFDYLAHAYGKFLTGKDEEFDAVSNDLEASYQDKNVVVTEEIQSLEDENESLKQQIQAAKEQKSGLPALEQRVRDYKSDEHKFEKLVGQLVDKKRIFETKIGQRTTELALKQKEYDELLAERDDLQARVAKQEVNLADVTRMQHERESLQQTQSSLRLKLESVQQDLWETGMRVSKVCEQLEKTVQEYNGAAARLELLPPSAKHAHGVDYELQMNASTMRDVDGGGRGHKSGALFSLDLKQTLEPALERVKTAVTQENLAAREQDLELQDEVESSLEAVSEAREEVAKLTLKVRWNVQCNRVQCNRVQCSRVQCNVGASRGALC